MSGSIKNMIYADDSGNTYAIRIDESNGEACGFTDLTNLRSEGLPKNVQMRFVNCQHPTNSSVKRRFPIGTKSFFEDLISGSEFITTSDPIGTGDIVWVITSVRGEKRRIFSGTDTGLNDGDIS